MSKVRFPQFRIFTLLRNAPIAGKLLLLVLVPLGIILVAILVSTIAGLISLENDTSLIRLQEEVQIIGRQFAQFKTNLAQTADTMVADSILIEAIEHDDQATLQSLLVSTVIQSNLSYLQIIDNNGVVLAANERPDLVVTPTALERLHELGLFGLQAAELLPTNQGWLLTVVRPIQTNAGVVIGVLSLGQLLDGTTLFTLNFERTAPSLVLLDDQGHMSALAKPEGQDEVSAAFEVDRPLWSQAINGKIRFGQTRFQREVYRVAYAPLVIGKNTAVFAIALSTSATARLRNQLVMINIAVVASVGLVTVLSAVGLGRRFIVQPVASLVASAERIMAGQLEAGLPDTASQDELGQLTATFNKMTNRLQQTLRGLEDHGQRLEIIARLSGRFNALLNLEELLPEVVNQIKAKFGYYHAHIYLLDAQLEKLVVAAGTGSAGAEMKAKGHSIRVDASPSLVARAARSGEIVWAGNVREAADWLPNPLLPDTYSEMVVPIVLEGQVVGVLDVQHDKIAGLDESHVYLLSTLANQMAVGIRNARQFAEVQTALAEAQALQERYLEQSWDRTKIARRSVGQVQFSLAESSLDEQIIEQAGRQALAHRELAVVTIAANGGDWPYQTLVAPVILQNIPIGDLQLHAADPNRQWSESDLALINAVVVQVAQTAENLRLFEETRERAIGEQTLREITNKMRATPNLDTLLETAARELGQQLGVRHTVLELGIETDSRVAEEHREPDLAKYKQQ